MIQLNVKHLIMDQIYWVHVDKLPSCLFQVGAWLV